MTNAIWGQCINNSGEKYSLHSLRLLYRTLRVCNVRNISSMFRSGMNNHETTREVKLRTSSTHKTSSILGCVVKSDSLQKGESKRGWSRGLVSFRGILAGRTSSDWSWGLHLEYDLLTSIVLRLGVAGAAGGSSIIAILCR